MKLKKIGLCLLSILTATTMSYSGMKKSSAAAPSTMNIPSDKTIEEYIKGIGWDVIKAKYETPGKLELTGNYGKLKTKTGVGNALDEGDATAIYVSDSDMSGNDTKRTYSINGNFAKFTLSKAFEYTKDDGDISNLDVVYTFSNLSAEMYGTQEKVGSTIHDHKGLVVVYAPNSDATRRTVCAAAAPLLDNGTFDGGKAYCAMNVKISFVDSATKKAASVASDFLWQFGDIDIGDMVPGNKNPLYSGGGYPKHAEKVMFKEDDFASTGKSRGSSSWLTKDTEYRPGYVTYYNHVKPASRGEGTNEYVQAAGTIPLGHSTASIRWEGSGCGTSISDVGILQLDGTLKKEVYDPKTSKYADRGFLKAKGDKATFKLTFKYHNETDLVKASKFQITDKYDSHYFFATPKQDTSKSSAWGNKFKMKLPKTGVITWTYEGKDLPDDTNITIVYTLPTKKGNEANYSTSDQIQAYGKSYAEIPNKAKLTIDNKDVDGEGYTADDNQASAFVPLDALTLIKTVNKTSIDNAKANDTVTYTYTIKNTGNSTLTNVNIYSDTQNGPNTINHISPSQLKIKSFSDGVTGIRVGEKNDPSTDRTKGTNATMPKGSNVKFTYTYTLNQSFIDNFKDGTPFTNTAKAIGWNAKTHTQLTASDKATFVIANTTTYPAKAKLLKRDVQTGELITLTSAKFKIYEDSNNSGDYDDGTDLSKGTYITNQSGLIQAMVDSPTNKDDSLGTVTTAAKFKPGTYFIREIIAPWRYALNKDMITFTISEDDCKGPNTVTKEITISNQEIYGNVYIHKQVKQQDNDKEMITSLAGNTFVLKAAEDIVRPDIVTGSSGNYSKVIRYHKGDVVATATTDSNGDAMISGVTIGYYNIEETAVSSGLVSGYCTYSSDDPGEIELSGNTFVVSNKNDSENTDLNIYIIAENPETQTKIRKVDSITNQVLDGAWFSIMDGTTRIAQFQSTSENNGWYTIGGLTAGHTYTLHEDEAPAYYVTSGNDISFTVNNSLDPTEVTAYNEPEKCYITVKKRIKASDVWISHGDPSFIINVKGNDFYGKDVSYEVPFTFTENEIRNAVNSGTEYLEKSQRVEVRHGTYWTNELNVSRYKFENIYGLTSNAVDNGDATASIDLMSDRSITTATVGYQNKYTRYDKWSHKHMTVNDFTSNYTNSGPYGRPWGGSHGTGTLS